MSSPNPYLMFFGGALVGAAAATLLAPRSGPATRKLLRDRAEDLITTAQAKVDEAQAALEAARSKARQLPAAVESAGGAAREAFIEALDEPRAVG